MSAKVSVRIQMCDYPSPYDFELCIPIDDPLMREVFEPLDIPTNDFSHLLISMARREDAHAIVRRVKRRREGWKKAVLAEIERALDKAVAAQDTKDGYSEEELSK